MPNISYTMSRRSRIWYTVARLDYTYPLAVSIIVHPYATLASDHVVLAFENVEKICQPPLLQKESQKEPPSKKSLSKVSGRKEQQPLFDLNPRIAREFLSRYQSRTNQTVDDIVTFQLPSQQFTQWKNEEEKAIKAEQPPEQPPSSFAQALLRKLNIVEEESGPKGSCKDASKYSYPNHISNTLKLLPNHVWSPKMLRSTRHHGNIIRCQTSLQLASRSP